MTKRISALLIALAIFLSMTACTMPQSIFPNEGGDSSDDQTDNDGADIYDFIFTLDGEELSLPVKYSVLSARGWNLVEPDEPEDQKDNKKKKDDDLEEEKVYNLDTSMAPKEYSEYVKAVKGESTVEIKLYNDSKEDAKLKECNVVGIKLSSDTSDIPKIELAGGIKIGSLYENIADTYGKPSYEKKFMKSNRQLTDINDVEFTEYSGDKIRTLYYSLTSHSFVEFELGDYQGNKDCAVGITVENDTELEKKYDYTKDMKKVPEEVELYKGPNLLGKKFSDFAFKYEDNLYTLPIPVRELVDDGWVFVRGASNRVQRGNTADGIVMRKGNLAMSVVVHNYDLKNIHTPINCYAVSLCASVTGPNVEIMLPKGITLGSDENDLLSVLNLPLPDEVQEDVKDKKDGDKDAAADANEDESNNAEEEEKGYVEKTEHEDYTVYSYIMPDDVPTVQLPVSITDVGDTEEALLGNHRKHIDVYVSNVNHKVVYIYMQNCPKYVVNESKIWEQQLAANAG